MNSKNRKSSDSHRLLINLRDQINLKRSDQYVALSNHSIYYTSHTKIMNLKYQLRHEIKKFELPDGSSSVSDIQDYFEYILKTHGEKTDNPSVRIYVNKLEKKNTFRITT